MDSVTQFALGATIGIVALGRTVGARKAALIGGLTATLPDLDVLIRFDDPIDQFTLHRGATHSLFVQTLATPVLGELLRRFVPGLRDERRRAWLTVWLCLTTHALLDAMTIYGTRLFWPVWPEPVGLGSLFIIDPVYTLPLLIVVIWALTAGGTSSRLMRGSAAALVLSTAYIGWSAAAQVTATARGERALRQAGVTSGQILATPTPFNTLFWRVIAVNGERYYNVYVPLLGADKSEIVYEHVRGKVSANCLAESSAIRKLASFADGFFSLESLDGSLVVSDLRMGLTPEYVFRFAVAPDREVRSISTSGSPDGDYPRQLRPDRDYGSDLGWLKAGIAGVRMVRPAEAGNSIGAGSGEKPAVPAAEC